VRYSWPIFLREGFVTKPDIDILKQCERMLLPNSNTRKLLATFCNSKPAPLNCNQFTDLQTLLVEDCPSLFCMIEQFYEQEKECSAFITMYNFSFADHWQCFFFLLAFTISVAFIFRPAIISFLLHLIKNKVYSADAHKMLVKFCLYLSKSFIKSDLPKREDDENLFTVLFYYFINLFFF